MTRILPLFGMNEDAVKERFVEIPTADGQMEIFITHPEEDGPFPFPFIAAQGGLPIITDDELIGSIGVSGVKAFEDEIVANAAIKAAFPQAKTVRAGEENDAVTS